MLNLPLMVLRQELDSVLVVLVLGVESVPVLLQLLHLLEVLLDHLTYPVLLL